MNLVISLEIPIRIAFSWYVFWKSIQKCVILEKKMKMGGHHRNFKGGVGVVWEKSKPRVVH